MITRWLRHGAFLAVFLIGAAGLASAQVIQNGGNLEGLLRPGSTVWITEVGGRETRTRVVSVSADAIATSADSMPRVRFADVQRIRVVRSDSLINGALIGAGFAVASGLFLCTRTEPWENCRDDAGPIVRIGAIGAGIGAVVDALIRRRVTIYEASRVSRMEITPILDRTAGGLQVSFGF